MTPTRESRLLLLIEATYLGRVSASTGKDWSDCPYRYMTDAWCWWAEAYEREVERREKEGAKR